VNLSSIAGRSAWPRIGLRGKQARGGRSDQERSSGRCRCWCSRQRVARAGHRHARPLRGGNEDAKPLLSMMPAKRAATRKRSPDIVFLASDKARFLTGQSLAVDGGYTAQ